MNFTLISLSLTSTNISPFMSIAKHTHKKQLLFIQTYINKFTNQFIYSNNFLNHIQIYKSSFTNCLDTIFLNQNLYYYNETFTDNFILSDISKEEVSIIDCHFINYRSASSIIIIGNKTANCPEFTLSGCIFQNCYAAEYGAITSFLSKVTLKNNCFITSNMLY